MFSSSVFKFSFTVQNLGRCGGDRIKGRLLGEGSRADLVRVQGLNKLEQGLVMDQGQTIR